MTTPDPTMALADLIAWVAEQAPGKAVQLERVVNALTEQAKLNGTIVPAPVVGTDRLPRIKIDHEIGARVTWEDAHWLIAEVERLRHRW